MNCAGCHGLQADGSVGPSLQASRSVSALVSFIRLQGDTPPMPQFQPSAKEMADILSYLKPLINKAGEQAFPLLCFAPRLLSDLSFHSRCLLPTPYAQTELTGNYPPSLLSIGLIMCA